jgi:hypothetical protein
MTFSRHDVCEAFYLYGIEAGDDSVRTRLAVLKWRAPRSLRTPLDLSMTGLWSYVRLTGMPRVDHPIANPGDCWASPKTALYLMHAGAERAYVWAASREDAVERLRASRGTDAIGDAWSGVEVPRGSAEYLAVYCVSNA